MKDYYGKCGSCIHCNLSSGFTFFGTTTFDCVKRNLSVKADEKSCSSFEPAKGRSNSDIEKYDR